MCRNRSLYRLNHFGKTMTQNTSGSGASNDNQNGKHNARNNARQVTDDRANQEKRLCPWRHGHGHTVWSPRRRASPVCPAGNLKAPLGTRVGLGLLLDVGAAILLHERDLNILNRPSSECLRWHWRSFELWCDVLRGLTRRRLQFCCLFLRPSRKYR